MIYALPIAALAAYLLARRARVASLRAWARRIYFTSWTDEPDSEDLIFHPDDECFGPSLATIVWRFIWPQSIYIERRRGFSFRGVYWRPHRGNEPCEALARRDDPFTMGGVEFREVSSSPIKTAHNMLRTQRELDRQRKDLYREPLLSSKFRINHEGK